VLWMLLTSLAFSQQATDEKSPTLGPLLSITESVEPPTFRLVVRGVAEQWNEPAIATVYQQGGLMGGIGAVVPIWDDLSLDVEFVYRRFPQGGGSVANGPSGYQLQILPISFLLEYKFALNGPMHGFAGWGPAYTVFSEDAITEDSGLSVVSGARLASEFRLGLRVDTGLITPLHSSVPQGGVQALELEIYGSRRMQLPRKIERLDLGAWRGCIGLGLRF
jgi:hypothetical protein